MFRTEGGPSAPKFDLQRTFNDLTGAGWYCESRKRTVGILIVGLEWVVHRLVKGLVVSRGVSGPAGFDVTVGHGRTARRA